MGNKLKPTPGTVQWIAPHLSEGELSAIYKLVCDEIIGYDKDDYFTDYGIFRINESRFEIRE